jgi:hypothetical protein
MKNCAFKLGREKAAEKQEKKFNNIKAKQEIKDNSRDIMSSN